MIKVLVKREAKVDADYGYYSENYDLDATLQTNEDTDAYEALSMFYMSMIIDGYQPDSIVRCMKEYVRDWEYENDKVLKIEEFDDTQSDLEEEL